MHELAQGLIASGHNATVLTGFPNYPTGRLYPGYRLRPWHCDTLEGVPVVRVPLYPDHSSSGVRRAFNYLSFSISAALLAPALLPRPDVIFVYHPPLTVGLPAFVMSRLWHVPFVYQIQDMWPESLPASGMLQNKILLSAVSLFAEAVYRWASAILVISPGFRRNLISKGVSAEKISYVSNWVDTDIYHPVQSDSALGLKLGLEGKFNVLYAGNVGEGQGLETILDASELLGHLPHVQFVVVGDGVALPRLRAAAASRGIKNVLFLGRFPATEMSNLYALADVLLLQLKDDPLYEITIPSKTFAYMAAGRPILAAITGDAADLVRNTGAGLSCQPGDPAALAWTVSRFHSLPASARREMGLKGSEAVRTQYAKASLILQIEELLVRVAHNQRA